MVKPKYIIVEQWIRNDVGMLAVKDEDKKITSKNYHEKLLSKGFALDNRLIGKDMVRELSVRWSM